MRRTGASPIRHVNKKPDLHNKQLRIINEKNKRKMDEIDRLRIFGLPKKSSASIAELVKLVELNPQRKIGDYGKYDKKTVNFDVVFCVSSFDRYEKIKRILEQVFSQETAYTFKFVLMNDGSTDKRYDELKNLFPDIVYLKNNIRGGNVNYWRTINTMWNKAKEFECHAILQLDDDFILCNNFLNTLLDIFFEAKELDNAYMIFSFHLYNFDKHKSLESFWYDENEVFVDGGMLIDAQFMKMINYQLDLIENRVTVDSSSFTWVRLKERLIEFKMRIYRFKNSLVWHDGNDDSKLHGKVRHLKRVYTKNYIDDNPIGYEQ